LVGAAVADLDNAPFGTRVRRAPRFDLAGKAERVAGEHRNAPAQFAKSRRRSPYRDRFTTRGRLAGGALAVSNNHLHADRRDMPTRRGEPAEQRIAAFLFGEMEALWIELPRKAFDVLGLEGKGPKLAPLADFNVFIE